MDMGAEKVRSGKALSIFAGSCMGLLPPPQAMTDRITDITSPVVKMVLFMDLTPVEAFPLF
jgi:hypothetical protein